MLFDERGGNQAWPIIVTLPKIGTAKMVSGRGQASLEKPACST
jgi:hypothetical protein